jgi:large subunit ribosomal protein L25
MATARLSASPRQETGKGNARKLRASGQVPAVVYGHARDPQALALPSREVERLLDTVAAASTVIELAVGGKTTRTLIREVQRHPFRREILHIDFQELVAGEKVTVKVPIVLVGSPEGLKSGGILDQVTREVEIEVDPSNIPNHLDVDVSTLAIGHSLHISDLRVPEGVTVLDDMEATIVVLGAPRAETPVAVEAIPEAPAEPELIRRGKEEEGEGEGEA